MERPLVSVVDDDESIRESLPDLLREFGFSARTFSSAEAFLSSDCLDQTRCLILDVFMPGMTGLELQQRLLCDGIRIPTIAITAYNEFGARERCEAAGASAFLLKPIQEVALISAVKLAMAEPSAKDS